MDHQINTLLKVSLENIKEIVDVDTVIGKEIRIKEDVYVIPISKIKLGFLAGGTNLLKSTNLNDFGGGSGVNVNISPVGFLVINKDDVKILHLEQNSHILDRLFDLIKENKENA